MNSTRLGGLTTFLLGGLGVVAVVWFGQHLGESGGKLIGLGWAVPAAIALVGLVQLVSGVPFTELSRRWDSLAGWQRGVLGTLIFILACGVIFLGIYAYVTIAYES